MTSPTESPLPPPESVEEVLERILPEWFEPGSQERIRELFLASLTFKERKQSMGTPKKPMEFVYHSERGKIHVEVELTYDDIVAACRQIKQARRGRLLDVKSWGSICHKLSVSGEHTPRSGTTGHKGGRPGGASK